MLRLNSGLGEVGGDVLGRHALGVPADARLVEPCEPALTLFVSNATGRFRGRSIVTSPIPVRTVFRFDLLRMLTTPREAGAYRP